MYDRDNFTNRETYEILKPLAVDAWGELHLAVYRPHESELLIRMLPENLCEIEGAWRLLCAEIQAWARIRHQSVLQVMDWGISGGRHYLATEIPSGNTLESAIGENEGVDNPEEVFMNLLKSVEAARQWGVLHLGLSPTNIWLSAEGKVEVGEYGLWYVTREFPGIGEDNGIFMAPEQAAGGRVGASTDVYSLGLIYIALKYGMEAARAVAGGKPLPSGLGLMRPVILRCLDKQPLARYRSTGELAADLGLNPGELRNEEYLDCPLCRLRDEIMAEKKNNNNVRPGGSVEKKTEVEPWIWLVVGALAVTAAVLWLLVIR